MSITTGQNQYQEGDRVLYAGIVFIIDHIGVFERGTIDEHFVFRIRNRYDQMIHGVTEDQITPVQPDLF